VKLFETLRPPSPLDPTAPAYKDWLHLNFADPRSGTIGLLNVSLHGSPWDPRSRAMGVVLVHSPEWGWQSHVEITGYSGANLWESGIALRDIALAIDRQRGTIHASSLGSANRFHAHLQAEAASQQVAFEQEMPLGPGWISWSFVSNLHLSGEWKIGEYRTLLENAPAYHDHNWGRWHWGDDFGWEWGCFLKGMSPGQNLSMVFARTTDRAHRSRGKPFLVAEANSKRRCFLPENVEVAFVGSFDSPLHRVPGAMAALHQEMAQPCLPGGVSIQAWQGADRLAISFVARGAAQFIASDPSERGYSFIHEMVGEYRVSGELRGAHLKDHGAAVFEYVM
jgi:hypothetical protein